MPTYDYECRDCGQRFEVFQSMKDPRLEKCLADGCGGSMKRLLGTGAGIIFKGSGFYETDYRSASYKAAAKKESESAASPAKADSGGKGGDSKPATPAPAATPAKTPASAG